MATHGSVYDQAIEYGLHLSDDFIAVLKEKQESHAELNVQSFLQKVLNFDLRKQPFVTPFFPHNGNLHTCQLTELCGPAVLQVVTIANVSEPSKRQLNGNSNDIYRVVLTDGHNKVTSFNTGTLSNLHTGTSPGTKVLFSQAKVVNGYLILTSTSLQNIGGKVEHLHEAFLANQAAQRLRMVQASKQDRSSLSTAPPPVFEPLSSVASVPISATPSTHKPEAVIGSKTVDKNVKANVTKNTNNSDVANKQRLGQTTATAPGSLTQDMKDLSLSDKKVSSSSTSRSNDNSRPSTEGRDGGRGRGSSSRSNNRGDSSEGQGRGRGRGRSHNHDHNHRTERESENSGERGRSNGRESRGGRGGSGDRGGTYVRGRYQVETSTDMEPSFNLADTLSFPTLTSTATGNKWVCKNCTFSNNYLLAYCEMCDAAK